MDQRLHALTKKTGQPFKLRVFITLLIASILSFAIVKTFTHQHKTRFARKMLSLPKLETLDNSESGAGEESEWQMVTTQSGDTLGSVFKKLGLSSPLLQTILQDNPHAKALTAIKPNCQIQVLIKNKTLEKMILPINTRQFLVVSRAGSHYSTHLDSHKMDTHAQYLTGTVQGSLFGTAKRMHISYKLINQMTEIFNWDIDFSRDVRAGDQFSIVYDAYYIDDKQVGTGDILAVRFTNKGKTYQAIRHHTNNGDEYYTPEGTSLKKAFSRYPLKFSHISSTFTTARFHPVLHYKRAHKGVDLAAPIGTPIFATGDGRIEIIERQSAYGNMIKIMHNKTYSSLYAHLLRFQKGLSRGSFVKRGQVIGYVGQSGLATGPHCHYEFHVNHQAKNPSTIALPRGAPITGKDMLAFKAQSGILLSRLKLYEEAELAAKTQTSTKMHPITTAG